MISISILNPKIATIQLSNVVPKLAPNIMAMAFFMVKIPAPTKASTINDTMELLCKMPVTTAPPKAAPKLFLVIFFKKILKFLPERFFNDSSIKYIANINNPIPDSNLNNEYNKSIIYIKLSIENTISNSSVKVALEV